MVLDPKGGARTNLLHNQSAQQMMPPPRRDNRENLRNHHDPQLKHTQPKHQQHQPQQHKQQHQQQHQHQQGIRNAPNASKVGNVSGDGSSIKNTIATDIENELNNPMVQSYLSTQGNSGRGDMQQSQFDFNNVTQSTLHTFDGIQNPEGVLNLLQTVRRIGEGYFCGWFSYEYPSIYISRCTETTTCTTTITTTNTLGVLMLLFVVIIFTN